MSQLGCCSSGALPPVIGSERQERDAQCGGDDDDVEDDDDDDEDGGVCLNTLVECLRRQLSKLYVTLCAARLCSLIN